MAEKKFPIKNVYDSGLPFEVCRVLGKGVLLQPVKMADLTDSRLAIAHDKKSEVWILRVAAIGPEVTMVAVSDYVIPISASVDLVDPRGRYVLCEQEDIRVAWAEKDLQ